MPDLAPYAAGIDPESELSAYLFWEIDACCMPPKFVDLLRGYALQRLRRDVRHEDLSSLSHHAARQLCRAHIGQAIAEFTAWTPLALRQAA